MKALVVEAGYTRSALAAVRALRAAGWTVGVGAPGRDGLATRSRAVSAVHEVPAPGEALVQRVAELTKEHGYEVVFGAGDAEVLALAHAAGRIGAALPHPPYEVLVRALDKVSLTEAAAAAGFPVPEIVAPEALRGRGIVKPRWHWLPGEIPRASRFEATVVDGPDETRRAADAVREAGLEPVVQPFVEGPLTAYTCVFDRTSVVVRSQQRALRIWPPSAGVSVRAVTVPVDPVVDARATRLLTALGWTGLAELQFVGDRLVDLNGRIYGSLALAVAAGANLPAAAAAIATGRRPPPPRDALAGVRYQWLEGDLRASGPREALRWSRGAVGGIWRHDDPLPGLYAALDLARRAARKMVP